VENLSKKGMIYFSSQYAQNLFEKLFPMYPLTNWCFKNIGYKIFIKNLDYFMKLNLWGGFLLVFDAMRIFINLFNRSK